MNRHVSALLIAALVMGLAAIPSAAAARSSRTHWVDDDGHAGPGGCGGTRYAVRSIQDAVDASGPGDTVIVCPGTYDEQVRIRGHRDGLTVRAAKPFSAQIRAPHHVATPLGFHYLVLVEQVDDVTIRGFRVVTRTHAPCDSLEVAVGVVGSRGTRISGNRLQAPGTVGGDCFQNIGIAAVDSLSAGQPGGGSPGFTATATIASNEVRDAAFAGIVTIAQTGRVRADIHGNTVRAWFGQPPAGTGAAATGPVSTFGIGLLGRSAGTVRGNIVQGALGAPESGASFQYGMVVLPGFDSSVPARNGVIDIRGNLVRRVAVGLWLAHARDVVVRGNELHHVGMGLALEGALRSRVAGNDVLALQVGIGVTAGSKANRIADNVLTGAGGRCTDDTTGWRTAGTANDWSGNSATQAGSPGGICPAG